MAKKKYQIKIVLISDTLIGSAEGYGATIDKDSVFDETGLPLIPGKRVKGLLREQAEFLEKMGTLNNVGHLFGNSGSTANSKESFSAGNFYLDKYDDNKQALERLIDKKLLTRSEVIDYFTNIRVQTSIDPKTGIAKDTSLRTSRVLKKGLVFFGEITIEEQYEDLMNKVTALTRRIGSIRNRGFGHIHCELLPVNQSEILTS